MSHPHHPGAEVPGPEALARFIFEVGALRYEPRAGWLRIGCAPESVAAHSFRAALVGYLLARLEGLPDPHRVAMLVLVHDLHEARTGDLDPIHRAYVQADERGAASQQLAQLGALGADLHAMWEEVEEARTLAGRVAKDAEILEMAFTARELQASGNQAASRWITSAGERLRGAWARRLLNALAQADPWEWWEGFQHLP